MPTFDYLCPTCDTTQEEFVTFAESDKIKCDECGSKTDKQISTPKIHLDGSDPNFVAAHDRWVKEHESRGNGVRT